MAPEAICVSVLCSDAEYEKRNNNNTTTQTHMDNHMDMRDTAKVSIVTYGDEN